MSDIAIRVEGLSKRYRIGPRERYYALRDVFARAITAPFRLLRASGNRRTPILRCTVSPIPNGSGPSMTVVTPEVINPEQEDHLR